MMSSSLRDNWERLVAAVVKKDQIWQLCHQDSITTVSSDSHSRTPSNFSLSNSSYRSPPQPPPASTSASEARKNASATITHKLFSALLWRKKPKDYDLGQGLVGIPEDHFGLQSFSLRELRVATGNFSYKNLIGRGGRSRVYKGRLRDGSLVAVKRLRKQVMGTELKMTSIAAHDNVVRALGFCITEKESLLVYAYMVNGTVSSWLRERLESQRPLSWPVRKQIALGVAKGLAYMHHECHMTIVHRDVKAANVLLDEDFQPVIYDFELAEFMDFYDSEVSGPVKGTIGHIAPEYLATGKYSVKNDVFGYGVFLLELITSQRSFDLARLANDNDVMLLDMVKGSYKERNWKMLVDADLQDDFVDEEVEMFLQIVVICTQDDPEGRPTMMEVARMLEVGYGWTEKWSKEEFGDENLELGRIREFTIHELQAATEDFSDRIISKDGFNMIYKGWLDGSPVAVKRYNSQSLEYYFEKELNTGRVCLHQNLVHVIGFCHAPEERLLVFRWMANGSVKSWLKGRDESRPPLSWHKRINIALDAARGLAYMHDECKEKVIHRDIKASNILLDENFKAVVADFKLAEFMSCTETLVTTTVAGTIGHIAPEYLACGKCSDKSDVFGYGAFLLELVTGQRIINLLHVADDEDMFCVDWVKRNYEERRWESMADEDSGGEYMESVVKKLVQIAVVCTQYDPDKRPKMSDVVRMFEVGGGSSAEMSEERSMLEIGKEDDPPKVYLNSEWMIEDDGYSLVSEQLSSPR